MAATLRHRGPDEGDVWADGDRGVALGFRRLAIVDLTPTGSQPMTSADGRCTLAFNGEIYNHGELRGQLAAAGVRFRGTSDTEVLLEGIALWGVVPTLERANGMFALAVWDGETDTLTLARDRLGEKPLYYGRLGDEVVFASELKALRAHPVGASLEVDRDAISLYLRHGYIPTPRSVYRGVSKLPPGTTLSVTGNGVGEPVPYWSVGDAVRGALSSPLDFADEVEATDALDRLLRDSVAMRMVADVPLGALLSGGIDSSTVVALMQAQSRDKVRTFSIGFSEAGYDEARDARAVADHLGTEHTELYVTPTEALDVIPQLPTMYDEPFSDSSQIPTYLVSAMARRHVTVALSGDGGDELFGGYNRYLLGQRLWDRMSRVPRPVRRAAASALLSVKPDAYDRGLSRLAPMLPARARVGQPGHKIHKLAATLSRTTPADVYLDLVSLWPDPDAVAVGGREPLTLLTDPSEPLPVQDMTSRMMYLDTLTYLPDDILAKVDRAAMATSLETRVPLLDHRLVEFAWGLPADQKIRGGNGKYLLRQVLARYVPPALFERPKMGFGVPVGSWLRGPLREWAEDLLSPARLRQTGLVQVAPVRRAWEEHLSGTRDWKYQLWTILVLEAWSERWR